MALTKEKLIEMIGSGDFALSNPNILHNWDFRNPVNQRGVSGTITTDTYFYDRWIRFSGSVTTNAAYLTVGASAEIEQRIEGNLLAGETVTVSVMVGGTVFSGTGIMPTSAGTASITLTGWGTATLGYATGYMYVRLSPTAASNVVRVKLEMGTVSTLANDPPADKTSALNDFMTYYMPFTDYFSFSGLVNNAGTLVTGAFVMPQAMRISPTFSVTKWSIKGGGVLKTFYSQSFTVAGAVCKASIATSDFTANSAVIIYIDGTDIYASADL